jgi:acetolactate synthase I/II/III large subunit
MELGRTLVEGLRTEGVDHIFLVPGGLVDPLYPVLTDTEGVRPIVAAHEAGAAFMADGYARASGRFGACLCIGGPGVLNQLTPIATARTDFSPLLVLSGSVPTDFEGRAASRTRVRSRSTTSTSSARSAGRRSRSSTCRSRFITSAPS